MRPAFSVVFLTTLIGAAQGLFVAAFAVDVLGAPAPPAFFAAATIAVVALALGGLAASFFHLGRPERAWRAAAMWRTSWLSREVLALPAFTALAAAWGWARIHASPLALPAGLLALAACVALFVCTAMIYASIRFLQEWASPFTLPNFVLMGCASGTTLACAIARDAAPAIAGPCRAAAVALTLVALIVRIASLARNRRLVPRSTTQSAIGATSPAALQKSRGFTGGSFNTHEFFHGVSGGGLRLVVIAFVALAFVVPVLLLVADTGTPLAAAAFAVQYPGLVAERWYFLADARHPQNLYYQSVA